MILIAMHSKDFMVDPRMIFYTYLVGFLLRFFFIRSILSDFNSVFSFVTPFPLLFSLDKINDSHFHPRSVVLPDEGPQPQNEIWGLQGVVGRLLALLDLYFLFHPALPDRPSPLYRRCLPPHLGLLVLRLRID